MKDNKKSQSDKERKWHLIDAKGKVLGRISTDIAILLRGKHKPTFEHHVDNGDFVVVINSEKVELTKDKESKKVYYNYSGYPGGMKETSFAQLREKDPTRIIHHSVRGMLPANKLRKNFLKRLKLVVGDKNPYEDKLQ